MNFLKKKLNVKNMFSNLDKQDVYITSFTPFAAAAYVINIYLTKSVQGYAGIVIETTAILVAILGLLVSVILIGNIINLIKVRDKQ